MARTPALARPLLPDEAHLSFSGGGFLGIYHVGVALAFRDFAPNIANRKVLGTSSGALAAMCLTSDFPMDKTIDNIVKMTKHCRSLSLGPLHPKFNIFKILRDDLELYMPEDAHIRSSGKLFVTVTNALTLKSEILTYFDSREQLIDVLMASCFIPYFLGFVPPKVGNTRYIDGGISCNVPVFDQYTITVSPFPGESIIGPHFGNLPKVAFMPETLLRLCRTVFAPPAFVLEELIHQGYDDAVSFLRKSRLILCSDCAVLNFYSQTPGDCKKCADLVKLSYSAHIPRSLLESLKLTAQQEQEERRSRRYMHTSIARTARIMFGVASLPVEISWAIARKIYDNKKVFQAILLNNLFYCRACLSFLKKFYPTKDRSGGYGPPRVQADSEEFRRGDFEKKESRRRSASRT